MAYTDSGCAHKVATATSASVLQISGHALLQFELTSAQLSSASTSTWTAKSNCESNSESTSQPSFLLCAIVRAAHLFSHSWRGFVLAAAAAAAVVA